MFFVSSESQSAIQSVGGNYISHTTNLFTVGGAIIAGSIALSILSKSNNSRQSQQQSSSFSWKKVIVVVGYMVFGAITGHLIGSAVAISLFVVPKLIEKIAHQNQVQEAMARAVFVSPCIGGFPHPR